MTRQKGIRKMPYELSQEVYDRVNSLEELGEEILFVSHKELWSINCAERNIDAEAVNENHITIYDRGIEECYLFGKYEYPTIYINVEVNPKQLKGVL